MDTSWVHRGLKNDTPGPAKKGFIGGKNFIQDVESRRNPRIQACCLVLEILEFEVSEDYLSGDALLGNRTYGSRGQGQGLGGNRARAAAKGVSTRSWVRELKTKRDETPAPPPVR